MQNLCEMRELYELRAMHSCVNTGCVGARTAWLYRLRATCCVAVGCGMAWLGEHYADYVDC